MAAITICSDFGPPKNKVWHCFHSFPIYFPWNNRTRYRSYWNFKNALIFLNPGIYNTLHGDWKIPPCTCEKNEVKNTNNILVLLWKQFCPCGLPEGVPGIPRPHFKKHCFLPWLSKCGPQVRGINITWEPVRNQNSQASPQTYRMRPSWGWSPTTWVLSGPAGDSDAHWGLSTTVLINFREEGRITEEKQQQGVVRDASTAWKIWLS